MSDHPETQEAAGTDTNTGAASSNPGKTVVKAFFVGRCRAGVMAIFAEAATTPTPATTTTAAAEGNDDNNNGDGDGDDAPPPTNLPDMDDSREDLRFVDRHGQEHARFIPTTTFISDGAMAEVKKYLYGVDVAWAPKDFGNVNERQLTRGRAGKGPVERALDNFIMSNGAKADLAKVAALT